MNGVFQLPASDYHDDRVGADQPSLSRSLVHILCTQSPAHAWHVHPRLNPYFARQEEERFDLGNAAHELFLGGPDRMAVIEHDSWRTNDSKEQRHRARVEGKLPLLAHDAGAVREMVSALSRQLGQHTADPPLFTAGAAEQTLVWEEDGVVCRARADWIRDDLAAIDDLKTTSRSANPESYSKSLFSMGYDVQAEFYSRGLRAVTGAEAQFRFVVVETQPPFALSVLSLGPDAATLARKKVDYALGVWKRCLESGVWPAYEPRVAFAELPPYVESAWLAKEEREMVA